jgi:hypothetical protein
LHKNPLTGDSPKPKGNGFGTTAVNIAAEPACMIFAQSDKKSDYASDAQSLCGVAYQLLSKGNVIRRHHSDH